MNSFHAKILILVGNPYVRPPDKVLSPVFKQAGKSTSPIPIRGRLDGAAFQQSLVRYQGDWRLYINGIMAKNAGLKYTGSISAIVGRKVKLEIEFDRKPPEYRMVPAFQKALDKNKKARLAYERLTPGRRKEILRYFGFMKSEESLKRNIDRVMQHLSGKESDALYPLMHRKR
jgi:hypothetical protein